MMRPAVVVLALAMVAGCRFDLPELVTDGPAVGCREDFVPLASGPPGHVYLKGTSIQNWDDARRSCVRAGAFLAIPDDAAEQMGLHTFAGNTFWIGVHDLLMEGTFVKVTGGVPAFLPWATGEPNNSNADEHCVESTATQLNDEVCSTQMLYVCECSP